MALTGTDVVIVGSGPAGCAAAARLLDEGRSVSMLEAGPGPDRPPAVVSLDALTAVDAPGWIWPDVRWAADGSAPGGLYATGRGVGGGSAVNSMVLTIGDRSQYDDWAAQTGDAGWAWDAQQPGYQALCDRLPMINVEPGPLGSAVASAFESSRGSGEAGGPGRWPGGGPSLAVDARGVLRATVAAEPAGRLSLVDALLRTEPGGPLHPGLDLQTGRMVRRVIAGFDGAVVGVELDDGTRLTAPAVVLCAGALRSPALAETGRPPRGVGPSDGDGVTPVMDHPSFTFTIPLRPDARVGAEPRPPVSVVVRCGLDGQADGGEPAGGNEVLVHVLDHVGVGDDGRRFGAVVVALAKPSSVGTLGSETELRPGWLAGEADRVALAAAVRLVASWLDGPDVAAVAEAVAVDDNGTELAALQQWSDGELADWLEAHPGPVRHPTSTLSPLLNPGRAPDLEGEAGYARGLLVADGSVLPTVPSVNPQLPIMVNAWRLMADL